MEPLLLALVLITSIFFVLLLFRSFFPKTLPFCVLCGAVSLTWINLLILNWLGTFTDKLSIALLLGCSVVGIFYLTERHTKAQLHFFKLPYFLTLLSLAYILIGSFQQFLTLFLFLLALWIIFLAFYAYRTNRRIATLVKKIMQCCKSW